MIVAVVRFPLDPPLSSADAAELFEASAPKYQNVPGLLRKHYLLGDDGLVGAGRAASGRAGPRPKRCTTTPGGPRFEQRYGQPPTIGASTRAR